jgi:hypothetical protein
LEPSESLMQLDAQPSSASAAADFLNTLGKDLDNGGGERDGRGDRSDRGEAQNVCANGRRLSFFARGVLAVVCCARKKKVLHKSEMPTLTGGFPYAGQRSAARHRDYL